MRLVEVEIILKRNYGDEDMVQTQWIKRAYTPIDVASEVLQAEKSMPGWTAVTVKVWESSDESA